MIREVLTFRLYNAWSTLPICIRDAPRQGGGMAAYVIVFASEQNERWALRVQ